MSLQIWLPLNGDLTQQGLSNVTASGSLIYSDSGKIGKCVNVDSRHILTIPYSSGAAYDFSFSFWIKIPTAMNSNTSWEEMLSFMAINTANSTTVNRIPINFADYHQVKIYDDANHQHSWRTPTYNVWEHWSIVHHSTASSSNIKFYINGILNSSYDTSNPLMLQNGNINIGSGVSVGSFALNDFRVYNHALSAKEVKELAKGLVLHYRLAGPGQENLVTSLSAGGQTSLDGTYSIHTSKTNADTYFYANLSSSLNPGDKVTVSCDVSGFSSNNYKWNFPFWAQNSGLEFWLKNGHCSQTFVVPSGVTASNRIIFDDNGATNGFTRGDSIIYIKNFKIERGSVQTPWCPNPTNALYSILGYNNNIEYDCSGYRRNGTKSGTITWDIDSPRYTTSYKWPAATSAANRIISPSCTFDGKGITMAVWVKFTGTTGGGGYYHMPLESSSPGYYEMSVDPSGRLRAGIYVNGARYVENCANPSMYDNKWHHIAITYNGSKICRYVDGKAYVETNVTGTANGLNQAFYLGSYGTDTTYYNNNIWESDARVYATALSSEDIAELYHSAVIVDNTGKSYAYEYFEA